jgi:hypothetical protein
MEVVPVVAGPTDANSMRMISPGRIPLAMTLAAVCLLRAAAPAHAQSLGDIARQEEARRQALRARAPVVKTGAPAPAIAASREPTMFEALQKRVGALWASWASRPPSKAAAPSGPALYRIFLKVGTPLVAFGEFARVGDRVVFTIALGGPAGPATMQLVSVPADVVDWDQTNQYADALRYQRYASTQAESDFATLTRDVADSLGALPALPDHASRLAAAERVRRQLWDWPAQHYAYRAEDVRDLASAVEDAVATLRAESGQGAIAFDLVATFTPPSTPLLAAPTLRQSIEAAAVLARATDVPADRLSLQAAILATLEQSRPYLVADWWRSMRRQIDDDIRQAARESQAATARQLKLDQAMRRSRDDAYRAYRTSIDAALKQWASVSRTAVAIRAMSGPAIRDLPKVEARLAAVWDVMTALAPPDDLRAAHDMLMSAVRLLQTAIATHRAAVAGADPAVARDASAAAAGALLLYAKASDDLNTLFGRTVRK